MLKNIHQRIYCDLILKIKKECKSQQKNLFKGFRPSFIISKRPNAFNRHRIYHYSNTPRLQSILILLKVIVYSSLIFYHHLQSPSFIMTRPLTVIKSVGPKLVPFFKTCAIFFVLFPVDTKSHAPWVQCIVKVPSRDEEA